MASANSSNTNGAPSSPPAPAPSTSSSTGAASSGYKLLSYVNGLRTRSEQAGKAQREATAANEGLADTLRKEKKEERRLAKEIEATEKLTRAARQEVNQLQQRLLELEARQAQAALQLGAARLLESTTSRALDQFKRESAAALAKHAQAGEAEAGRTRVLAQQFEEAKQQLAAKEATLQAASEARAASQRRLGALTQEREQLGAELAQEKEATEALRAEGARLEAAKGEEMDAYGELSAGYQAMRMANQGSGGGGAGGGGGAR